jgi:hypothetical protein
MPWKDIVAAIVILSVLGVFARTAISPDSNSQNIVLYALAIALTLALRFLFGM